MTRTLVDIPSTLLDPRTGAPAFGSYRGAFRRTEVGALSRDRFERLATEKRWFWGSITQPDRMIAFAIVDLGYAASAFTFVWEAGRGLVVDRSLVGVPRLCRVRSTKDARIDARFVHPRGSLRVRARDGEPGIEVAIELPDLEVHATLDERGAPPALTAVAPVPRGVVNTTEKRALMAVRGAALIAGRRVSLDDALGGYDHTHGLLARRTQWNWAFAMGRAQSGERVAFNLVQGFVGEPECALWIDGALAPLPEGRFEFDRDAYDRAWRITTPDGAVDLAFEVSGIHREDLDLRLVKSRFVQPSGTFRGAVRAGDRTLVIENVPGVVEDQDVLW
ncbi:DUF2804 domain-containing protein [Sandaracinus amylolyticus]|uniref:DUF2804 domain-containing protein n=1 Tax=Sandaracinus amylolyticus TaxID=927083 RepID=UPI001F3274CE|nr:DUF2804 domain-containing protein [Sandaracinus amylolyticus]UJR81614.1 Hypothetical protein I5071_36740 [Sandaracinus amylolyticus]